MTFHYSYNERKIFMKFSYEDLHFEKVSFEQWKDTIDNIVVNTSKDQKVIDQFNKVRQKMYDAYDNIKLPERATAGSVGYDFFTPIDLALFPGVDTIVPTGIRVYISPEAELWLMMAPKSGLGTRYKMKLNNTIGVIDSDYYGAANEGHIMLTVSNGLDFEGCPMKQVPDIKSGQNKVVLDIESPITQERILTLASGKAIAQGIFMPMITMDDKVEAERIGGFGSTEK